MPQPRYSKLAQDVGAYLVGQCDDGRPQSVGEALIDAFPDVSRSDLDVALAELEHGGLVTLSRVIGPELPRVRPTYALFALADPAVTGHSPERDAVELARQLYSDARFASIATLFAATGWDHRRFNPALGQLLGVFGEGRYSKSMPSDFATNSVVLGPSERLALRRFIEDRSR